MANVIIALALLTLGCQIAAFKPNFRDIYIYISLLLWLLIAPALAFILLKFLNLEGVLAQALFISTAMPTAVNSSIIAQEYNNEPQYAAQTVVKSTLVSSLSVTIIISFTWRCKSFRIRDHRLLHMKTSDLTVIVFFSIKSGRNDGFKSD